MFYITIYIFFKSIIILFLLKEYPSIFFFYFFVPLYTYPGILVIRLYALKFVSITNSPKNFSSSKIFTALSCAFYILLLSFFTRISSVFPLMPFILIHPIKCLFFSQMSTSSFLFLYINLFFNTKFEKCSLLIFIILIFSLSIFDYILINLYFNFSHITIFNLYFLVAIYISNISPPYKSLIFSFYFKFFAFIIFFIKFFLI